MGADHPQPGDEQAARGQGQGCEEGGEPHAVGAQDQVERRQDRHRQQHAEDPGAQDRIVADLREGSHGQVVEELLVAEVLPPGAQLGPREGPRQALGGHQRREAGVEVAVPLEEALLEEGRRGVEGEGVEQEEARAGPGLETGLPCLRRRQAHRAAPSSGRLGAGMAR